MDENVITDRYALYQGDCLEVMPHIPDDSIHLSIYSPPFAGLYQYSSSAHDLSNCRDYDEFFEHYGYVVAELSRLTMPGRMTAVHCMDIPQSNTGKGDTLLPSGLPRCTTPDCAFITRVVRLSLEAIFSSRLSWVNLIQYDNVTGIVGINSRLHWIPQAGREGYLVINHNLHEDPLRPDQDYHTSFAEVTVKYSYTFRF